MKKLLLGTLVMLFVCSVAKAQTEKGNWLVGGNLELNTAKNNTIIGLSPSAAYFFLKNLALGAKLNLDYTKVNGDKSTIFGIGPFARYYLGTLNIRPFADAELSFQSNKYTSGSSNNNYNSTQYFLGAGLAAFINRNVAVEGLAGYRHTAYKDLDGSGGFNFRVGFQIYISEGEVKSMTN